MLIRSGETVATVTIDDAAQHFDRAEVVFQGLQPPITSFEVRVFLDETHPDAGTATDGNIRYLGSQFLYGVGAPAPPEGAAPPEPTQWSPRDIALNVTLRLRAYATQQPVRGAPLTVVAVDSRQNEIAQPELDVTSIALVLT